MATKVKVQKDYVTLFESNENTPTIPEEAIKILGLVKESTLTVVRDDAPVEVTEEPKNEPASVPIVSAVDLPDGEKGVRLCVGDVDIVIESHDFRSSKKFEWEYAMKALEEDGKRTFNQHEALIAAAFRNEINEKLCEIGGQELDRGYWSSTEYSANGAWYVGFYNVYVNYYYKCNTFPVRACAAFIK